MRDGCALVQKRVLLSPDEQAEVPEAHDGRAGTSTLAWGEHAVLRESRVPLSQVGAAHSREQHAGQVQRPGEVVTLDPLELPHVSSVRLPPSPIDELASRELIAAHSA